MSEPKINQKHWPIVDKYVGEAIDQSSYDGVNGFSYFSTAECVRSQRRRVYGDEINLAKDRIKAVKTLNGCYEEGYTKDIAWK